MDDTQRDRNQRNENVAEFIDQNQIELNTTAAVTEPLKDACSLKFRKPLPTILLPRRITPV